MIGVRRIPRPLVWVSIALLLLTAVLPVYAGTSQLEKLDQRHDLLGFEAVGRLDSSARTYCTATLISPELVLTAAHCVYGRDNRMFAPSNLTFRAGFHEGKWVATRAVRRIVAHPKYDHAAGVSLDNVRHDVALLELATGVSTSAADPFVLYDGMPGNPKVSVVSYGKGRESAPSWQRACQITGYSNGVQQFNCDVTFGSSGSPVFTDTGSRYQIISVISSIGEDDSGIQYAYGMDLPDIVQELKAQLRQVPVLEREKPTIRRISVGTKSQTGGAKFVRSKD